MIFIGATYEVACYTTQHIHNNCCRFQNFPFKCFEIVSLALHMLIPRLMMRKAQIYRIQNLNIFRFCHTAPLPHWGWFSIQYFEHIRCHAPTSRILKCLFKYVTRNWNISLSPSQYLWICVSLDQSNHTRFVTFTSSFTFISDIVSHKDMCGKKIAFEIF